MVEEEVARIGGDIEDEITPEEEQGIPGHAGKKEWAKRLQGFLRESGISFEAEGEATRIHLGMLSVEVTEAGETGYAVVITIPLPGSSSDAEDEEAAKAYMDALKVLARLGADEIRYELDTDMPGYPVLRAVIEYSNPDELASKLIEALKPFAKGEQAD
jgi:hypothetical protein